MVKNLFANAGDIRDAGSMSGLVRFPEGERGNPLQYSCLENHKNRGAWQATVHRTTESWTRLSDRAHALNQQLEILFFLL